MPGDYTRFTFKPRKNYAAVLRQQGRVGLDSDFNEMSDLADRRWRAETMDVIGRAAVSDFTDPDAFRVTNPNPTAPGNFDIGVGRMYVDGLLAENHGRAPEQYNAALGEMRGTLPVPYTGQPYLPTPLVPPLVPPPLAGRTDLVYLDVWRRELTFIEDPEIREVALGGPDTATRLQTVWQVKVLKGVGNAECGSDIAAWNALVAPSTGRLTTATVAPPPSGDPCVITPEGGYRGLENRLYRVEVHTGGALGTAKFKWSSDNASVASTVTSIEPGLPGKSKLRLRSLGRDRVLRFNKTDWIEVLDEFTEFGGHPPGQSGFMAQVVDVDEADQALFLDRLVPAGLFNPLDPARHTRVRRWDQKASVDGNGLMTAIPGPIDLGDSSGIRITFGGQLRVGDYWVFAARTANGTIEELTQAPPRGVLHHYARLAIVHWGPTGGTTTVDDCRPHWPPKGGCCLVVRPGESIQAAINSLPPEGGCVCLKVGTHPITQPIRIQKSNVTLHGETVGARVVRANGAGMVEAGFGNTRIDDVTVAFIRFEVTGGQAPDRGMISAGAVDSFTLEGCELVMAPAPGLPGMPLISTNGVALLSVHGAVIDGNELERLAIGVLGLRSSRLEVSRNLLRGPFQRDPRTGLNVAMGEDGILAVAFGVDPLRSEHNRIENYAVGIRLDNAAGGGAQHSLVVGNEITRQGVTAGAAGQRFAIEVLADHCTVAGNSMNLPSGLCGGIRVAGLHALIADNHVDSTTSPNDPDVPAGIVLGPDPGGEGFSTEGGVIRGNRLTGRQNAIRMEETGNGDVLDNQIEDSQRQGELGIQLLSCSQSRAAGNRIEGFLRGIDVNGGSEVRLADNLLRGGTEGVLVIGTARFTAAHNQVVDMRNFGFLGWFLGETAVLSNNGFHSCGYASGLGIAIGIGIFGAQDLQIESCEVLDTGVAPDLSATLHPAYGIFGLFVEDCRVVANVVAYTEQALLLMIKQPQSEDRALVLQGILDVQTEANDVVGYCAQVLDNRFQGPGLSALIEFRSQDVTDVLFRRFERVIFSNNWCHHHNQQDPQDLRATVQISCHAAIVIGNQIKATFRMIAVDFHDAGTQHVFLGNVVRSQAVGFSDFPTPKAAFNLLR